MHVARLYIPTIRQDGTAVPAHLRATEIRRLETALLQYRQKFTRFTGVMRGTLGGDRPSHQYVDLIEFTVSAPVTATRLSEDISRRLDVGPVELELDGKQFFCLGTNQEA